MNEFTIDGDLVRDQNNNTASILYWRSQEEAEKSLRSLTRCSGCSDCSGCSGCSDCSDCSDMIPAKLAMEIPSIPKIHTAIREAVTQPDAFDMRTWHLCDTMHCRAGWVVHLAGQPGYELERRTSTLFAAQQIYKASGYEISPVRFYDTDEAALADINRLADAEVVA